MDLAARALAGGSGQPGGGFDALYTRTGVK